jgi:hypothetical protein
MRVGGPVVHHPRVSSVAWFLLRSTLPYLDPFRRRRVRKSARSLIVSARWLGDDATSLDIAELALLRLLWLQRETHRAARARLTEATALSARAAVETCIAGLYWIHRDESAARLRSSNAKSLQRLLAYIAAGDPIPQDFVDEVVAMIGPPGDLPTLREMATTVAAGAAQSFATDIYHRLYVPLSTFYPHPTGLALLRHAGSDELLHDKPLPVWTRRAGAHSADACVAGLAAALAERRGRPVAPFVEYADAHMQRTVAPVFMLAGRSALRSIRWSNAPNAYRAFGALIQYYRSGQAANDTYEERKLRTKRRLEETFRLFGDHLTREQREVILDRASDVIAQTASPTP